MNGYKTVLLVCTLTSCSTWVGAQSYPSRPIRMIVPFPAGGGSDTAARTLAPRLSERLKQQIVVENRPGAAGAIGTEMASRAAPDGYTVLLGSTSELTLYPAITPKPAFDTARDFLPVALVSDIPFLMVVHPSLPAASVKELVALAKKRPGEIVYGSAGTGATSHLTVALFCHMTGTNMLHVPYKTSAIPDLLGGHLQLMMTPMPGVLPHAQSGRLRALAVSSPKRWPTAPSIPTMAESGLTDYDIVLWTGVLVPTNTPQDIINRLYREIAQVLSAPEVVQAFASRGGVVNLQGPEPFRAYINAEIAKWTKVARQTGVRLD